MRLTIGVMGASGGALSEDARAKAYRLGEAIATRDAILITGARGSRTRLCGEPMAKGVPVVGIWPGFTIDEHRRKIGVNSNSPGRWGMFCGNVSRRVGGAVMSGLFRSRSGLVLLAFLAIGGFFVVKEHTAHVLGVLPYLLVLACPLLHLFHGGHGGGHAGHGPHGADDTSAGGGDAR